MRRLLKDGQRILMPPRFLVDRGQQPQRFVEPGASTLFLIRSDEVGEMSGKQCLGLRTMLEPEQHFNEALQDSRPLLVFNWHFFNSRDGCQEPLLRQFWPSQQTTDDCHLVAQA